MQRRSLLHSLFGASLAGPVLTTTALSGCAGPRPVADTPGLTVEPPPVPREFRAAWVATVANIDWPSRRGLSDAEQIAEIRALLDSARALRLNALVLQVRTSADALYPSTLEPWSEYLSGTQGQGPGYDPLALWLEEAHARGLELHVWINPYRARQSNARSATSALHVSQRRPEWVKRYGDQLWIDPGEPEAAAHTLAVCRDLLTRYAVDGFHIDDYFYPYPVQDPATKQEIDFPDDPSWRRYVDGGGTLARADWRRDNVDRLVHAMYDLVRELRPQALMGVSPFGLPRPDLRPAGVTGFSQYDKLYADVERWLAMGWLDYLAPQLYWPRTPRAQAFEPLLRAWQGLNPRGRHVWPGLFTSKAGNEAEGWSLDEIPAQVALSRAEPASGGHLHFSMVALQRNRRGLADTLRSGVYAQDALPPESPWLSAPPCGATTLLRDTMAGAPALRLTTRDGAPPARFALWRRDVHQPEALWRFEVIGPGGRIADPRPAEQFIAAAVNALHQLGPWSGFAN